MLTIDFSSCLECGGCVALCPETALMITLEHLDCDDELCTLCGICLDFCPVEALGEEESAEAV